MKKILAISLLALTALSAFAQSKLYDIKVEGATGDSVQLAQYKGKVLLIVNTATRCGFTPQYKDLEALYAEHHCCGLEILDFPCNQFGAQAPGTIEEIHEFCTANYDIHFTQFEKIDVNGPNASPLFVYLKSQKGFGGFDLNNKTGKFLDERFRQQDPDYDKSADIKWNFTKFLVDREGRVVARFEPTATAEQIEAEVKKLL